ncbi:MAG: YkgJ family cysteine cluster protein [Polyangiaceae bacterium]
MTRDEELSALCLACGACCDGTMYARVELDGEGDRDRVARRGLPILEEPSPSLAQPCAAHVDGRCTIYEDRPERCAGYRCEQHRSHERDGGSLEARLARVRGLRAVAARVAEARSRNTAPDALDLAELGMRLRRDFGWKGAGAGKKETPPSADPR